VGSLFVADAKKKSTPIWLARGKNWLKEAPLAEAQKAWAEKQRFKGAAKEHLVLPGPEGAVSAVVLGVGEPTANDPMTRPELLAGLLPGTLPAGLYHFADAVEDEELACVAWGLGAYRFRRYKAADDHVLAQLKLCRGTDLERVVASVEAIWLGRDLINTPASDLGPEQLEEAARTLARRHGAKVTSIVGDDLLSQNFPLIHAVGRASARAPRLVDLVWGRPDAQRVTVVGKGICFDTGGLDIKPANAMLLMKKDMGGAAAALALAHMIMSARLNVRLRVLIPAAENSLSGNALRPGDVVRSRAGQTVEIGNTDAEGRLVLADALALADGDAPDTLLSFATLTGAARVALGPELPALYSDDEAFATDIVAGGSRLGDPVWRMPLWSGYETNLDSAVADLNNVSETPFAGSIMAALFLRRFVKRARRFAFLDIYAWRPANQPLGPKGGEVQGARALFEVLRRDYRQQDRGPRL
jgi:leucyl aminopeptidase